MPGRVLMLSLLTAACLAFACTTSPPGVAASPSNPDSAVPPTKEKKMTTHEHEQWDWNEAYTGDAADLAKPDALLLKTVLALPPGKMLDVGCGAGGLMAELAAAGWTVSGIDLASKAIDAARAALGARGITAELAVADATTWRPTTTFDLITNAFALPVQRAERAAVFSMVKSAVTPGGVFVLKEFDTSMGQPGEVFAGMDLVSLDELQSAFNDWTIERLDLVETPAHGPEGESAPPMSAAFLVARKP